MNVRGGECETKTFPKCTRMGVMASSGGCVKLTVKLQLLNKTFFPYCKTNYNFCHIKKRERKTKKERK